MNKLQKWGGLAAITQAFIYIAAFIFYFAILEYPTSQEINHELEFLANNQLKLTIFNLITYVFFGVLLVVLNMAIHQRLKVDSPTLTNLAAIFGFVWVVLVIASGMIANIGLVSVIQHSELQPDRAMTIWLTVQIIVEGLGGGNEIVGGLWVLFISLAGLSSTKLTNYVCYLGLLVGLSGISTIYPAEILTEIFGLSQIIWFLWIGISLCRKG